MKKSFHALLIASIVTAAMIFSSSVLFASQNKKEPVALTSADEQNFVVGLETATLLPVTITHTVSAITASSDIRLIIPSSLSMAWASENLSAITFQGDAILKIASSTPVTLIDEHQILIDVIEDFEEFSELIVFGLVVNDFSGVSTGALELDITGDGVGDVVDAQVINIVVEKVGKEKDEKQEEDSVLLVEEEAQENTQPPPEETLPSETDSGEDESAKLLEMLEEKKKEEEKENSVENVQKEDKGKDEEDKDKEKEDKEKEEKEKEEKEKKNKEERDVIKPDLDNGTVKYDLQEGNLQVMLVERGGVQKIWHTLQGGGPPENKQWETVALDGLIDPFSPLALKEGVVVWVDKNKQTIYGYSFDDQNLFAQTIGHGEEPYIEFEGNGNKIWRVIFDPVENSFTVVQVG